MTVWDGEMGGGGMGWIMSVEHDDGDDDMMNMVRMKLNE